MRATAPRPESFVADWAGQVVFDIESVFLAHHANCGAIGETTLMIIEVVFSCEELAAILAGVLGLPMQG